MHMLAISDRRFFSINSEYHIQPTLPYQSWPVHRDRTLYMKILILPSSLPTPRLRTWQDPAEQTQYILVSIIQKTGNNHQKIVHPAINDRDAGGYATMQAQLHLMPPVWPRPCLSFSWQVRTSISSGFSSLAIYVHAGLAMRVVHVCLPQDILQWTTRKSIVPTLELIVGRE